MKVPGLPFFTSSKTDVPTNALDPSAELLIEIKNGHQIKELSKIMNRYDLEQEPAFVMESGAVTDLDDFYAINIPDHQMKAYRQIVADLQNSGLIDAIEENEVIQLDPNEVTARSIPSGKKYGLNDPMLNKVWAFDNLKMEEFYKTLAKNKVKPKKRAKIAILDTGVDGSHEDLRANYVSTRTEYDEDPHGHGTHCAGIAAAVSNNSKGIASVFPSKDFVQVTSIQVFPRRGGTTQRIIINGMLLAADKGADVISMSLGGPSSDRAQRAYRQAVEYANKKGAIVVVAAGNERIDARRRVPASVEGVITVSATDINNDIARFSNFVSNLDMGIAAPGVDIYSTVPGSRYQEMSGTSMATPYVAGLLGLMKAIYPEIDTRSAYQVLSETGMRTKANRSTGKLIQPNAALKKLLKK